GKLSRVVLSASFSRLEGYARPRLREALGQVVAPPRLWPLEQALGVGISGELGALAFDLVWAPSAAEARWIVVNARGAGGVGVPLAQALRVAEPRRARARRGLRQRRVAGDRRRRAAAAPLGRGADARARARGGAQPRARAAHARGRRRPGPRRRGAGAPALPAGAGACAAAPRAR